jgi:hypothetical protein
MVNKIPGASWITETEEAHLATHVIASDGKQQLKRTPKLMIAMNKTPNIVLLDWFTDSAKKGIALPCDKFLVKDKGAEKEYGFIMDETIERIKEHLANDTAVLIGKHIYVCKGVAGKKAPKENELKCIVLAAGGEWLANLNNLQASQLNDVVIITSSEPSDASKQIKVAKAASAIKRGVLHKTTTWLFDGIMAQQLDFDASS